MNSNVDGSQDIFPQAGASSSSSGNKAGAFIPNGNDSPGPSTYQDRAGSVVAVQGGLSSKQIFHCVQGRIIYIY